MQSENATSLPYRSPKVSVIGCGNVGSTTAQRVLEKNLADVVLLDIIEGRPQAIALDLLQANSLEYHNHQILGTNDYADTHSSDIVIISAGLPRKPGMSRDDLLQINAKIVMEATRQAIVQSPNAILIVVTNPLDVMTYLAWQVSHLPVHQVMGMAGILDSARFKAFIGMTLGVSIHSVNAMVLGGHGDLMVPLPRYSTINGVPISEFLDGETLEQLIHRTRHGGAEIVELMKTGGAYFAPASAICLMVEAILLNQSRLLPVSAYLQGEYGLTNLFLGVPCQLAHGGIKEITTLALTDFELNLLHNSARSVRETIDRVATLLPNT